MYPQQSFELSLFLLCKESRSYGTRYRKTAILCNLQSFIKEIYFISITLSPSSRAYPRKRGKYLQDNENFQENEESVSLNIFNTAIVLYCTWFPILSKFIKFLHSFMYSILLLIQLYITNLPQVIPGCQLLKDLFPLC